MTLPDVPPSQVAAECSSVSECLAHLKRAGELLNETWSSLRKVAAARCAELSKLSRDYGGGDKGALGELADALASGSLSPAALQYFQTVFNEPAVGKAYRAVESTCSIVESMVRTGGAVQARVIAWLTH